jgi:hypothetical protein
VEVLLIEAAKVNLKLLNKAERNSWCCILLT